MRSKTARLLVWVAMLAAGCGGDGNGTGDAGPNASCEEFATEEEELLNAETNATVVQKTPAHPPVGDGGLP